MNDASCVAPGGQPVRLGGGVELGEEHTEDRAQLQQLVPVAVVARQPRGIQAEHEASLAQADLGDQPLEALARRARCARLAQVIVDHRNPLARPAETAGPVDQPILQFRALLVLANLAGRGLADIDVGELGTVRRGDLLDPLIGSGQHAALPRLGRTGGGGRPVWPAAPASFPAGSAMVVGTVPEQGPAAGGKQALDGEMRTSEASSKEAATMLRICRAKGSSVRTEMCGSVMFVGGG